MDFDEAAILRTYRLHSLEPTSWEDVDHEAEGGVVGTLAGAADTSGNDEPDPLGFGGSSKQYL